MAEKTPNKNQKSMEETLWDSANKLRGTVESSEYKHVVLGLIFLKFASDKFELRKKELIAEGKEKYLEMKEFYNMKNVFFLAPESRWSTIMDNAKQNDIAIIIDTALHTVEKKDFSLVPSKYSEFVNRDENIDFDEKMMALKSEFAELLKAEEQSKKDLLEVFKTLGYGIE